MHRKSRKIQNHIILIYSIFVIVLVTGLSVGFYFYNVRLIEVREYENMQDMAEKTMQQVEDIAKDLDSVALEVIYNQLIIQRLSSDMGIKKSNVYIPDIEIRNQLLKLESFRQIINKKINRISIFNEKEVFFTTKKNTMEQLQLTDIIKQEWVAKTKENQGKKLIRGPFTDYWDNKKETKVISLNRLIRVSEFGVGYVEIQLDYNKLEEVFLLNTNYQYVLLNEENKVVYSKSPRSENEISRLLANNEEKKVDGHLIYIQPSDYLNWQLIILYDAGAQIGEIRIIRNLTFLTGILVVLCSVFFISQMSRVLIKPILKLIHNVNQLDLNNLSVPIEYDSNYDETNKLNQAFQAMYKRLDDAIKESYRFQNMQLKAHFDVLQAQINPHFMYNTLGIIANMGEEAKQTHIANTCYSLIDMLRYTNDVNQQWTTIENEMEHTRNYLLLMKKRYEHRLIYHIQLDERLLAIRIPKLILQPMVENSLQHGFDSIMVDTMQIRIVGIVYNDRWEITISDNGSGMDINVLESIKAGLETYKTKILNHLEVDALTMGGMGILSTFARLYIFYKDNLTYSIKNNEVGMSITFGQYLSGSEENDEL